jgi:hypothetical protein
MAWQDKDPEEGLLNNHTAAAFGLIIGIILGSATLDLATRHARSLDEVGSRAMEGPQRQASAADPAQAGP